MFRRLALLCGVGLTLSGCGTTGLSALAVDGPDLHPSLVALPVPELPLHVPHALLRSNPQHSADADFVAAVARGGSQGGRLDAQGVQEALYAVYRDEDDVTIGVYGMETESAHEADRREARLREIWAHNARADRTRVHRGGNVLAVVFCHPATPAHWDAVNDFIAERIGAPEQPAGAATAATAAGPTRPHAESETD